MNYAISRGVEEFRQAQEVRHIGRIQPHNCVESVQGRNPVFFSADLAQACPIELALGSVGIVFECCGRPGNTELGQEDRRTRATNLTLLMKTAPHLALGNVGNGRLHELNGTRNILAHSHFDQDPWDGTFEIVKARHRSLTEKRLNNLNADSINKQADELEDIAAHMSAVFDFIDHPVPAEYLTQWPAVLKSRELWDMMQEEAAKPKAST